MAAETGTHYLLVRGECIALVERKGDACGSIGGTGILTPHGLAFLVWREGRPVLAAKGSEEEAGEAQVEDIRRFSRDVKEALAG